MAKNGIAKIFGSVLPIIAAPFTAGLSLPLAIASSAALGAVGSAIGGGNPLLGALGGGVTAGLGGALGAAGVGGNILGDVARGALSGAAGSAISSKGKLSNVLTGSVLGGLGSGVGGYLGRSAQAESTVNDGSKMDTGGASEGSQYAADSAALDATNAPESSSGLSSVLSGLKNAKPIESPGMLDKISSYFGAGTPSMETSASDYLSATPEQQVAADVSGATGGSGEVSLSPYNRVVNWASNNPLKAGVLGLGGIQAVSQMIENASPKPTTATAAPSSNFNLPLENYKYDVKYVPYTGNPYTYGMSPEQLQYISSLQRAARGGQIKPATSPLNMAGAFADDGQVYGEGKGQDDKVPALLSQDEYVSPADVIAHLGDGSSKEGGKVMDKFVAAVRQHKMSKKGHPPKAKRISQYLASVGV